MHSQGPSSMLSTPYSQLQTPFLMADCQPLTQLWDKKLSPCRSLDPAAL